MDERQRELDRHFRGLREGDPPPPWRRTFRGPVGGFEMLGFAADSELLLVVSSSGRGVFDCETGQTVARDYDPDLLQWADESRLTAEGIGPLHGQDIRMTGIPGGGLPTGTADGWSLHVIPFDWTECLALLCPAWKDPFDLTGLQQCSAVHRGWHLTAFGFSYTGRTLVITEGSGVLMSVYNRAIP